jgi:lysozyme family protein
MTKPLHQVIAELIEREGAYSNHASDAGGETHWGITRKVARDNGYLGEMREMPRVVAERIYREIYWERPGFSKINVLSPAVADELLDTAVNMGVSKACEFLQVALNALNRQGKDYPDLKEDGEIGEKTIAALTAFLRVRKSVGQIVMVRALNCLQGARYIEISRQRGANEDFVYGWLLNRVGL